MLIYLVRHARPEGVAGLCYGRSDVRPDEAETRRAAGSLRASLPADVLETAPIYSSPLARCAALARELVPARVAVSTPELLELDFGSWEGSAWNDVPRAEVDEWARDPWGYAPGGGESAHCALLRFQAWANRLWDEGNATVIAVTHAGLMRLALSIGSVDPIGLSLSIAYGSVHPLAVERRILS
jgi:alpha-ribazole phosphatase